MDVDWISVYECVCGVGGGGVVELWLSKSSCHKLAEHKSLYTRPQDQVRYDKSIVN